MIEIRPANQRGHADHGWLKSAYTFSFASYYDPEWMGFRVLRVMNEDRVQPGKGFGKHPHDNMEIISYVLEGELKHQDSMGNGSVIRAGDLQRMSAGSGVTHSEFNPSGTEPVHFYQIWILPNAKDLEPGYEQKTYSAKDKKGKFKLVASRDGREGSLTINQDVAVYLSLLEYGTTLQYQLTPGRYAWLQVLHGRTKLNELDLGGGDGAEISAEGTLIISATENSEVLLFDLP